jgi:pyridoxamine 5'-phosphate oxidase
VTNVELENPIILFTTWFDEAKIRSGQVAEIAALATVSANLRPSVRMINFKGLRESGFSFFSNYESQKGEDLISNPWASLLFHWPEHRRHIRVQGRCKRLNQVENNRYFSSRDRKSQATVVVSQQSRPLPSGYEKFLEICHQTDASLDQLECPSYWGGYTIIPDHLEFWEGKPARRHHRVSFALSEKGWQSIELYP